MHSSDIYSRSDSDRYTTSTSRTSDPSKTYSDSSKNTVELDPPQELYPLDQVWNPISSFPGIMVAVDEKGTLILSGPRQYLDIARNQIREIVYNKLGYDVTNDIRTLQFEEQL